MRLVLSSAAACCTTSYGAADTTCPRCKSPLRLIALIKTEDTIKKILAAMGLPTEAPKPHAARPPPSESGDGGDWLN